MCVLVCVVYSTGHTGAVVACGALAPTARNEIRSTFTTLTPASRRLNEFLQQEGLLWPRRWCNYISAQLPYLKEWSLRLFLNKSCLCSHMGKLNLCFLRSDSKNRSVGCGCKLPSNQHKTKKNLRIPQEQWGTDWAQAGKIPQSCTSITHQKWRERVGCITRNEF